MIIWLHEKLYRYVKDNPGFNDILTKFQSVYGDGDLSTYHSVFSPERRKIYTQAKIDYYNFFANLDMPEDLKIRWQISTITDTSSVDHISEEFFKKIEEKIEDLPNSSDKISCKIYLIQHKIIDLIENLRYSYFDPAVYELRKELLRLYNSDMSYSYEEETHASAHFNKADTFFFENVNTDVIKDKNWITFAYERLIGSLNFYEETALRIHPTEYMKHNLEHSKLHLHNNFYAYFISSYNEGDKSFADMEDWFEEKYNNINFKYKDFNYYKLKHLWNRFSANMGHGEYMRGMNILQTIYDIIASNMQNKNLMGKKLNYLANSYHTGFFAFIASIRNLETQILNNLNFYTNKNQFNSLSFSENEEKLIADEWHGDGKLTQWTLDYSWLQQKLTG